MKKLTSIHYNTTAFNTAMLLLRIIFGLLMMHIGYEKLIGFEKLKTGMMDFMHLGKTASACLVIFAEFFCSLFLILGLFTRLSLIPLIITMSVALFHVHHSELFDKGSSAGMYLTVYIIILLLGPGKLSVDGMISK